MSMLFTTGLTSALLSAKVYYSAAENPMQRASQEFQNRNTDLEILNRSLEYGTAEMFRAEEATFLAGMELQKAQAMARREAEELQASRIEERREKNAERASAMRNGGEVKPFSINYSKDDDKEKTNYYDEKEKKTMWNFLENKQSSNNNSLSFNNSSSNNNSYFNSNTPQIYNRFGVASSFS